MFSSTIIPTIGRSSLTSAVRSVLDQDFAEDDFEIIVVNDSGQPLFDMDWQNSKRVRIINTNCRERSVARNTGAAIAKGKYLHFLDDDDVLLPGALEAFWILYKKFNNIAWFYGSYQTVDNDGNLIEEFHPNITGNIFALLLAGESIPFQASIFRTKEFYEAGTFDPNISYGEDRDLGRRIARLANVAWIPKCVTQIRVGELGSTSDWSKKRSSDKIGREKALNLPKAYSHIRASINLCQIQGHTRVVYLRGRVFGAYLGSLMWNLQYQNFLVAIDRIIIGLILAGFSFLSVEFWRGLRKL